MSDRPPALAFLAASAVLALLAVPAAGQAPRPTAPSLVAAAGADGALILADLRRPGLFRRAPGGRLDTFAAAGPKDRTPLRAVTSLVIGRDGVVYAGDRATGEVYRVRPGSSAPEPLTGGALEIPTGLMLDPRGDLVGCDLRLGTVFRIPATGGAPVVLAHVPAPRGVAPGPAGEVVVLSMGPDQVLRVTPDGEVRVLVKGKPFTFPIALLRDEPRSRHLVSDGESATIWAVDDAGAVTPWVRGQPLVRPEGLALDASGALLVADPGASRVFRVAAPDRIESLPGTP